MKGSSSATFQKMNPFMWGESRTVKKAVLTVDELVANATKNARFLKSTPEVNPNNKNDMLAVLDRSELQTGKLLGEGSFSQVYELTSVTLLRETTKEGEKVLITPQQDAARRQLQAVVQQDKYDNKKRSTPSRYAIKQVKRELLRTPEDFGTAIADLVVEAKYLTRMDHPNILKIRGLPLKGTSAFFESGRFDSYFIVTDRLLGGTLDQRIEQWQREGPADPTMIPRKTNYALQMANALYYLHQRRIIFRDLKPENVGFLSEHVVQLFDFGLVRELPQGFDHELYAMSGAGSQWYMAIEIFLTGKYNLKADVYSWAMTFYECLTETKPFAKLTKLQHVASVCVKGKRPKLSNHKLPHHLQALLRDAWTQSVSQRPTIRDVIQELEAMLPEMGDEEACKWPTVEHTSVKEQGHFTVVQELKTNDDLPVEASLSGADDIIDEEIFNEMKKKSGHESKALEGLDDNEFSISSLAYSDH